MEAKQETGLNICIDYNTIYHFTCVFCNHSAVAIFQFLPENFRRADYDARLLNKMSLVRASARKAFFSASDQSSSVSPQ